MRNGWTLIELLIVLLLAGVLALQAVPAFRRLSARSHLVVVTNTLSAAMYSARLSAINKNKPVTFCAGTRAGGCSNDWSAGHWQTFVDYDHDGTADAGEPVLQSLYIAVAGKGIRVDANGPFKTGVVYMPSGAAERISGAFAAGRLRVCSNTSISPNATDIVLSATGRVRLQHYDFKGKCPEL